MEPLGTFEQYTNLVSMVAVCKDYEPGQRWPSHPDDQEDEMQAADSLEELSDLSSGTDPAPLQLNAEDLKLQR